ncbi:hypothetical protein BDZ94DRAFT_835389 [Collybia nuda]|uniref:Telomerase reverse transcriptase n=1 Tax=Collybia nuda TaxID=64659 RepID=A0A9P5YHQ3_9AGAR|nr:hypothetical protein BDZ94DRAFT_835389 [Collybia nuda]
MSRTYPTCTILGKYFSVVKELKSYLSEILQPSADGTFSFMPNADDTPSYTSLVNTSYVAMKTPLGGEKPRFQVFDAMANMHEVLDKAQEKIFKSKQPQNIITAGYRMASRQGDRGKQGMNRPGVTNYFVNTVITALQAPEWETLLQRSGCHALPGYGNMHFRSTTEPMPMSDDWCPGNIRITRHKYL